MSKILDDLKRAAAAREALAAAAAPKEAEAEPERQRPLRRGAKRALTQQTVLAQRELDERAKAARGQHLDWAVKERASFNLAARPRRVRWLRAASAIGVTLAIGIGIGSLIHPAAKPGAGPSQQPLAQTQSGPPLELRLDRDIEQFGRQASATAPRAPRDSSPGTGD